MKIVVTGHKGFIGSHYYKSICDNHCIYAYDRVNGVSEDLSNPVTTENMPDCDVVMHLAATNGTRLFYEKPTDILIDDTLSSINLIKRYRGSRVKFVFASSCEVFNGATDAGIYPIPTDENVPVMFNDINNPRWSYSLPKAVGENLLANSGLDYLVIRYFNIYGPGQQDHFINEFVDRIKQGCYYINGNDTRSFCYVDDAIEITNSLVMNHKNCTVNVGNQAEIQISVVAKMIMDIMGVDPGRLEIFPSPQGSASRRCPDTTLAKKLTGFDNYTPLTVGLQKTIESLL